MVGREHMASGALVGVALAPLLPETGIYLAVAAVLFGGAGVVCDIDEPGSTIARSFGFLTGSLAWVVHVLGGGHRKLTHSILGVTLFTFGALEAGRWQATTPAVHGHPAFSWHLVPAGALLAVLFASAFRVIEHKPRRGSGHRARPVSFHPAGHWYDLAGIALAAVVVWTGWDVALVTPWHVQALALAMALGMGAHICGDMMTHDGCPLLYPFIKRDFGIPEHLRITTDGFMERWVIFTALLAGIAFFAWRDTSATITAIRIHQAAGGR